MSEETAPSISDVPVESVLRQELAHGDALIGTIAPILRHLLANDDHSVFSDEIIARVRGMMRHLACQLLDHATGIPEGEDGHVHDVGLLAALSDSFVAQPAFLAHIHALALEWQLTERMQSRLALDPVLSPLVQALIASSSPETSSQAMSLLAAQARFAQAQRRMQLPLGELPGDLLHGALIALRAAMGANEADDSKAAAAESAIRGQFDESRTRLGLIARLVTGMGGGATAALSLAHAGVPMFLSALALASGQDRDMAVLATNEGQLARLALALRAAGLKPAAVEEQFGSLHPEVSLPGGFDSLGADRAAAMLARSGSYAGG